MLDRGRELSHYRELDELGYVRLEGFVGGERLSRLVDRIEELFAEEGDSLWMLDDFTAENGTILALDDPDNDALSAAGSGRSGFMT